MYTQVAFATAAAAAAAVAVVACSLGRQTKGSASAREASPCDGMADKAEDRGRSSTRSIAACAMDDDGIVTLADQLPKDLASNKLTLSTLNDAFKDMAGLKTVVAVVEELLNLERGGALIVVYDCKGGNNAEATMPVRSVDEGRLKDFMRRNARSLLVSSPDGPHVNPMFRAVLRGYCASQGADRSGDMWTKPALEDIAKASGESWDTAHESLRALMDKPLDGALAILSLRGTVVAASCMIDITSRIDKEQPDGRGTRLRAAIHTVEWCRFKGLEGAAAVRSDDGVVTLVTVVGMCTRSFEVVKA